MNFRQIIFGLLLLIVLVLPAGTIYGQQTQYSFTLCSWNIANLGGSKSDDEIAVMARTLRDADVVAVQEVVTNPKGAQAVARLAEALNRTGGKWAYAISDPTTTVQNGSERYAFLWKSNRIKQTSRGWLDSFYRNKIDREPYMMQFEAAGRTFTLVSFHAVPKAKNPESEIKYLKEFPQRYKNLNLIFCGDFNTPQSHNVFNPLKQMGYRPALTNQKTTLRQNCTQGDCLASEYDNFFMQQQNWKVVKAGIYPFHEQFSSTKEARFISDHVPVYLNMTQVKP